MKPGCAFALSFATLGLRQGYTTKHGEVSGAGGNADRIVICAGRSLKHK